MIPLPESFPALFIERYKEVFNDTALNRILAGFRADKQTWYRVNPLISESESAFKELAEQGVTVNISPIWPDVGWVEAEEREKLLASSVYEGAKIYIQGLASQIPVWQLNPQAGDRILDLAAAPGSKTLQIVGAAPTAEVAAVEIVRKRKFKLQENLQRNGAKNVRVFLQDGTKVWRYRPEHFDRVLLDAPCSSEGRFQLSDESSYSFWTPGKSKEMIRKQRRLLFSAIHSLKVGGTLVYSTCAISPDENEGIVQHVLDTFATSMEVDPIDLDLDERIPTLDRWRKKEVDSRGRGACRLMPSNRMEGFFVCRFRKTASSDPPVLRRTN